MALATRSSLPVILGTYALYTVSGVLVSVSLQRSTMLTNWDDSFPLLLGNERTGDRQWRGRIFALQIAGRALDESEVEASTVGLRMEQSLIGSYRLDNSVTNEDELGRLAHLSWHGGPTDVQGEGAVMREGRWLESSDAGRQLARAVGSAGQFTLGVWVVADDLEQTGPARIVSLSESRFARNFMLGQEGGSLVVRLRTPLTGQNGIQPELVVPGVFQPERRQQLLVTYDGAVLRLFVDGRQHSRSLELGPGAALFGKFVDLDPYELFGYKVLYFVIVGAPLGVLLAVAVHGLGGPTTRRLLWVVACAMVPALALEMTLHGVSGKLFRAENVLLASAITLGSAVLCTRMLPRQEEEARH